MWALCGVKNSVQRGSKGNAAAFVSKNPGSFTSAPVK
jgi:hypothetical protein